MQDKLSNKYPLVSIFCFCKNRVKTISRCIDSILAQDYPNIEIIVQDGASTDGTLEILRSYGDKINLVSEPDSGAGEAMFRALNRINGEFFGSCLSDEELLPHAVSWAVENLTKYPDVAAIYGDHYLTDIDGNITGQVTPNEWNFEKYFCSEVTLPFCASFFRRSCYESHGLHKYTGGDEFDFWIRLGARFPIRHVPGLVSKYAVHPEELSLQTNLKAENFAGRKGAIERLCNDLETPESIRFLRDKAIASLYPSLVRAYCKIGAWDLAKKNAPEAFRVGPNSEKLHELAGLFDRHSTELYQKGQLEEALEYLDLLVSHKVVDENINGKRAKVLFKLGRIKEAVKASYEELKLQPDNRCVKAIIQLAQNCPENTQQHNEKLAKELFKTGIKYLSQGDAIEAIKHFEEAAADCATMLDLHYAIATAYTQLGNIPFAIKACEAELKLQPEHDGTKRLLERIEKAINEYEQNNNKVTNVKVKPIDRSLASDSIQVDDPKLKRTGIIVFGHSRPLLLRNLLRALHQQGTTNDIHVWLDGHHGRSSLLKPVTKCRELVQKEYPEVHLTAMNGNIGIEKLTIDGLSFMSSRYDRIIVLEDDCFPTADAIAEFEQTLDDIATRPEVYSVYGHHFLTETEGETITRFQGWGWATTREKLLPVLTEIKRCFAMPEPDYLQWVGKNLTPQVIKRLDVTPGRNCVAVASSFFCWDSCTCLITATRQLVHKRTTKRVIYNCGMGDSTHFPEDDRFRQPPFNMISPIEVWDYYDTESSHPASSRVVMPALPSGQTSPAQETQTPRIGETVIDGLRRTNVKITEKQREAKIKGSQGENLIFLISQPRAGSTLLQRILSGHPEIYTIAEPWIMLHPLYALKQEGITTEYVSHRAREGLDDFLADVPEGQELYTKALREMALVLYNRMRELSGKHFFLDKTPRYYYIIPELYRVFPRAKFVMLLRNPMAVLSSVLSTWLKNQTAVLLKSPNYSDVMKAPYCLIEGIKQLGKDAIVIHYENLVTDSKRAVLHLCNRIGIPFYENMLEYGQCTPPKGRFGDPIGVHKHNKPVSDYIDKWVENLSSPDLIEFARQYLSTLGPVVFSSMGYSYQETKEKLDSKKLPQKKYQNKIEQIHLATSPPPYPVSKKESKMSRNITDFAHPILVYQMGKVGSSTIKASLDRLNLPNYQVHLLSWSNIKSREKYYQELPHKPPVPKHIELSKHVRSLIDNTWGKVRWKVITLVREPVALAISGFFQNMADMLPHLKDLTENEALKEITEYLLKNFSNFGERRAHVCSWFDKEIKDVFGFDVYSVGFRKLLGYQIYEAANADILVLKLEKIIDCHKDAFQEFLGIQDFLLVNANVGQQKKYHKLYNQVLESISIPEVDLNRIYASRHCQHFYTVNEIANFKDRWLGKTKTTKTNNFKNKPDGLSAALSQPAISNKTAQNKSIEKIPLSKSEYLVSAIISTYNSEKFIRECLEDLENQTIADRLEIIVVNSGSQQNEESTIREFQSRYDNIKYIRTEERETIYKAWNRGIKAASGKYITNANTDDRHRKDALEIMAKTLDENPTKILVYANQLEVNEIDGRRITVGERINGEFSRARLFEGECPPGSQPMWRKDVHDVYGYFDEKFVISGDYEFWFRITQKFGFLYLNEALGERFLGTEAVSQSDDDFLNWENEMVIRKCYEYALQEVIMIGATGISENPVFSNWPEVNIWKQQTKAKLENRQISLRNNIKAKWDFRTKPSPKVTIVVVAYNRHEDLLDNLYALNEQSEKDFEVIVLDNGGDLSWLKQHTKEFNFGLYGIELEFNFGPSPAKNIGTDFAKAEYIVFLDDDAVADKNLVRNIVKHFENHKISGLRGKVLTKNQTSPEDIPVNYDLGDKTITTACEVSCLSAFRKDVLIKTGGFDELLFGPEGMELSYRICKSQKEKMRSILYFPDVIVYHNFDPKGPARTEKTLRQERMELLAWRKDNNITGYKEHIHSLYPENKAIYENLYNNYPWIINIAIYLSNIFPEEAVEWAKRAVTLKSERFKGCYILGSLYTGFGRFDEALPLLGKIYEPLRNSVMSDRNEFISPEFDDKVDISECYIKTCTQLAQCYTQTKQYEKVKQIYTELTNNQNLTLAKEQKEDILNVLRKLDRIPSIPAIPANKGTESAKTENDYLISAIISTYNSEKFLSGCLEDLEQQTISDKLEIIVVNSGSQENEESIVHEYQQKYDNIVYIKTDQREGIYTAWNRAVKAARGIFLTNANTDDRHRYDALEIMAETLQANPDIALVYGDQICTDTPNCTFADHHAVNMAKRPEYSFERLLFGCCVGSQPMWRKTLHNEFGFFDETLSCAGDWDFWLRISSKYKFKHIPEFLGLYYYNEDGIEHGNKIHSLYERYIVGKRYGNPYISVIPLYSNRDNLLVSVIMPAYNAVEYIAEAIESVLIQNYRNFELIVVDDGSSDNTRDIIAGFKDDKIKYFCQENRGPASARNVALSKSKGQYIIPLDSDDMMTPDFIAKHLQEFEMHPEADLIYCDDYLIDDDSKPIRVIKRPEYQNTRLLIRNLFHNGFPIIPFRTCFRRGILDKIGLFDEELLVGEDYDMIRRFVRHGLKMHHLQNALYLRRMTNNSLSKNYSIHKAQCHFEVIKRFADTFTYDELFPDVCWDEIEPRIRQLHAKCLIAGTYLKIGQEYVKSNVHEYSKTAFDRACSELNDCIKMDPENQALQQLFQKSQVIRARYAGTPRKVISKEFPNIVNKYLINS